MICLVKLGILKRKIERIYWFRYSNVLIYRGNSLIYLFGDVSIDLNVLLLVDHISNEKCIYKSICVKKTKNTANRY